MSDDLRQQPPTVLSERYHLIEQIGSGGNAVVYRAEDSVLGREVAIKILAPNQLLGSSASERFLREARAVARLSHPNIMAVYDVNREGRWHFLVLEYIAGQDLKQVLVSHGGKLETDDALNIIRSVLDALGYAHHQGVIHRDIKPQNILLSKSGVVKVADFGLARVRDDVQLTQEGMVLGTMAYMAPEMMMGERADERSDLYAVGAVLYELLTGTPPYMADMATALISQVLNAPIPSVVQANPRVPARFQLVFERFLAKSPDERFSSAEDVLTLLNEYESSDETDETSFDIADTSEFAIVTAVEDTASAIEAERRRLSALLEQSVVSSLDLLLRQANIYEQTLGQNMEARTVASVMASLARQSIQQLHDLRANLYPTSLQSLGLEPSLETLVSQYQRTHGVTIRLWVERMQNRLSATIEIGLFRLLQTAIERAVNHGQATRITLKVAQNEDRVQVEFTDNGLLTSGLDSLTFGRERIRQLGGQVDMQLNPDGGLSLNVEIRLIAPIDLTPREIEVLRLMVEGLSNKQIAHALSISPRTINFHLDNIYSKMGVHSRTEAAIYALRNGLVTRTPRHPT
jgi:serine/threonine protein kinase/DNA-binding CsgD family transcriptional regulator